MSHFKKIWSSLCTAMSNNQRYSITTSNLFNNSIIHLEQLIDLSFLRINPIFHLLYLIHRHNIPCNLLKIPYILGVFLLHSVVKSKQNYSYYELSLNTLSYYRTSSLYSSKLLLKFLNPFLTFDAASL